MGSVLCITSGATFIFLCFTGADWSFVFVFPRHTPIIDGPAGMSQICPCFGRGRHENGPSRGLV